MELEPRVTKLESNHSLLVQEFKQINRTLEKIEIAIEKQGDLLSEIKLLTSKVDGQERRITDIESSLSKVMWIIVTGVIGALLTVILK